MDGTAATPAPRVQAVCHSLCMLEPLLLLCLCLLRFPCLLGRGGPEELGLLLVGLEPAMPTLGRGVYELQSYVLTRLAAHLGEQRLAKSDDLLPLPHGGALQHDPILIDDAVMRETAHWRDWFLGQIVLRVCIVWVFRQRLAYAIDLLVDLSAVVVAHLARPWHLPLHSRWVPRADTSDLPQSAMGLPHQTCDSPASDNSLNSLALGHSDAINHLVLRETVCDLDSLLKETPNEIHFLRNRTSIHLDLFDVSPLLPNLHFGDLGVADCPDTMAILLDAVELCCHRLPILARLAPALLILGEGLLLGLVPVLVEPPLALLAQVSCPNTCKGAHATRSLDVSDEPHHHHRWSLKHSHRLADFLFVDLRSRPICLANNVRHPSLVSHEGCEMRLLRRIILRKAPDSAKVVLSALTRREAQATMTGAFKLPVRHAGKARFL